MIVPLIFFVVGMAALIKGSDYFIEGGGGLARRFGVFPSIIGFSVIAFGTSLPELVVNVNAVAIGNPGIALGNVLGSNIANVALVLALCAFLSPELFSLNRGHMKLISHQFILMILATIAFFILALRGFLDIYSGIILLLLFVVFIRHIWNSGTNSEISECPVPHGRRDYLYLAGGALGVAAGSYLVVNGAIQFAGIFGIPDFIVGFSMVAIGTSLPELATSLSAILKKHEGVSIGNILGSNIFNLLFIMGVATLIGLIPVQSPLEILIVLVFSIAVFPLFVLKRIGIKIWSCILFGGYLIYLIYLFS